MLSAAEYTLDQLIQAGLNSAYTLKQQEILLQNANLDLKNSRWDMLPAAEIAAARVNNDGKLSSTGSLTISKALTLNEPTYFSYKSSQSSRKAAALSLTQTRKQLVYNIYTGWLDILQKQREMSIQLTNLEVLQQALEQSRLLQELGKLTSYEVTQNEINLINAQLTLESLKNQILNARQTLFSSLQLKDEGYEFTEGNSLQADTTLVFADPQELPLTLKQLKEEIYQTRLNEVQQHIAIYPSLRLSGSYVLGSTRNEVFKFGDYADTYSLSLNLSWSLWSPWQKGNSYSRIKNTLLMQEWQLDDKAGTLENNRNTIRREWESTKLTLSLNQKKAAQAEENLRIASERYRLGNLTQLELDQARVQALEASLAVNAARFELLRKVQQWKLECSYPLLGKY